jgi:hypothetical protein
VLTLAFSALLLGAALWWPRTVDDAFITFRYAANLVDGVGAVFNPGERVEGYSSPSWMLLTAAAIAVGADPVPVAKGLGLLASILTVVLVFADTRRIEPAGRAESTAVILLGTSVVLQIWSVAGMETNAYGLLFMAGLVPLARDDPTAREVLLASSCLAAAALTRPEGVAFWTLGAVVAAWGGRADRLRRIATYVLPGVLILGHLAWRIAYYGIPLPNTYYAKTGGGLAMWAQGLHGLRLFVTHPAHILWLTLAAAGAYAAWIRGRERRRVVVLGGAVVIHLLYVVSVGDDGLRIHRFYVPVLAPLAALAALVFLGGVTRRAQWLQRVAMLAVAFTVAASTWTLHLRMLPSMKDGGLSYQRGNVGLGRLLGQRSDRDALIAVPSAGAIPFYSRLRTIDMYGLNDPHIARVPFPDAGEGRLMKWDNAYVLSLSPDLIVINRGYFAPGDPNAESALANPGIMAVSPMDRDLFARVARDGRYGLATVRLDDGGVFYVFRRAQPLEGNRGHQGGAGR